MGEVGVVPTLDHNELGQLLLEDSYQSPRFNFTPAICVHLLSQPSSWFWQGHPNFPTATFLTELMVSLWGRPGPVELTSVGHGQRLRNGPLTPVLCWNCKDRGSPFLLGLPVGGMFTWCCRHLHCDMGWTCRGWDWCREKQRIGKRLLMALSA